MYNKNRHFSLSGNTWDKSKAEQTIQAIATDVTQHLKSGYLWPTHPLDDDHADHGFYFGTAGMSWALDHLQQETTVDIDFDVAFACTKQLEGCQKNYAKMPHKDNASYFFGDFPILMMQYKLSKDQALLDEIYEKIIVNNTQPTRELMWGAAGTMIALSHLAQIAPHDPRWKDAYLVQADRLFSELQPDETYGFIWEHDIYGGKVKYLGPMHGNSGNTLSLIKGHHFLPDSDYNRFCEKAMLSAVKTAQSDAEYANWPAVVGNTDNMVLHFCHGAPGMICALSELPIGVDHEFDQVLLKGGELIWQAGPLVKGYGLCHGTAGNGFALLKLYQRTQDQIWLDRARVFAMEAIEQYQHSTALFHQGRYNLWNGDGGLAIYLNECVKASARFPTIDTF